MIEDQLTIVVAVFIALGLVIVVSQLYVARLLYQYENSIMWFLIGLFLVFGLNVYVYQIFVLEKRACNSFQKLHEQERKTWRKVYLLVLTQYLLLFVCFGLYTSP
ncbi:hypothetical protein ACI7RC_12070 [Brevibacillus sp. B_LB10_24]|uniref:hypothetical protein n=1 Tax=Brevibacillus sp. B_LB10_24 TaxID=3380645 RepID=UPI0038B97CA9